MNEFAQYVRFLIGLAIVIIVAVTRYNHPSWLRTFTPATRYYFTLALYVASQVAVYYVLCLLAQYLIHHLPKTEENPSSIFVLFAPTLAPLAITLLLPFVPFYDRWPRKALQKRARMTEEYERLTQLIVAVDFHPDPRFLENTNAVLLHRGIDSTQHWLSLARPAQQLFVKATTLFLQIRSWEESKKYALFIEEARNDFDTLRQRFDQLSLKVSRTFANIERIGKVKLLASSRNSIPATPSPLQQNNTTPLAEESSSRELDDTIKTVVGDMIAELHEDVTSFFNDACKLAVRGILSCELTSTLRNRGLRKLGFRPQRTDVRTSYDSLAYAAGILFLGATLIFAIFIKAPEINIPIPLLVTVITLTHLAAFAIAIVPKQRWRFANSGMTFRTPIWFVIGAGITAVVFAACMNLLIGYLHQGNAWPGAITRLREAFRWLPMAFATATVTAHLIQDHTWLSISSPVTRRALDGCVLGAGWAVGSICAHFLPGRGHAQDLDLLSMAALSFAFGSVLGCLVPGSFRERRGVLSLKDDAARNQAMKVEENRRAIWQSIIRRRSSARPTLTK